MTQHNSTFFYHLVAFITVAIWGTTFVSTKVLMLHGLSPAQIFTLRFFMAYVLMLCFNHRRLFASSWRDEGRMMLLGITGGSLYFLSENEAMNFTTATNTSLIVCSCPLFATLLVRLVYRSSRIHVVQLMGSLLAFVGMVIVVLNGRFVLHLSPVGRCVGFHSLYVLGCLFAAHEVDVRQVQCRIHHAKGVLLWRTHHSALLCRGARSSLPGGAHASRGTCQPALPGLPGFHGVFPHVELVHLQVGSRQSHQLGLFQPHLHHDLCLLGTGRENHSLLPRRCCLHPHRYVHGRQEDRIKNKLI